MTIQDLWQELELSATTSGPGILSRRVHQESSVDLFVGVSRPDMHRMFMLGVADDIPSARPFPAAHGIHVDIVRREPDAAPFFVVELLDRRFETIFTPLVDDLVNSASTARTSEDAVAAIVGQLQRWQRFLAHGAEGLGWKAQRGLYGELYFMRHRLAPAAGVEQAVASWTGPSRAPQDFQFHGWAVEVKPPGQSSRSGFGSPARDSSTTLG